MTKLRQAMVFCAGLGTRLRPLSLKTPKPLVEIGGQPMLAWIAQSLQQAGVERLVLNTHWLPEQVETYAQTHLAPHFELFISREPHILGTGGGLYQARQWLDQDFFLVNADILTDLDFARFGAQHLAHETEVSLAVNQRPAASSLLVDEEAQVVGLRRASGDLVTGDPVGQIGAYNFTGIHALSPYFLSRLKEPVASNLIEEYLKHLAEGLEVRAADISAQYWSDVGTPEELDLARQEWGGLPMQLKLR
ncbi:MAG: sugar phosphate nucleotidyltransferase [bacterium]|nr:sugar phosphate nucleotidyltransferase [bacterium]